MGTSRILLPLAVRLLVDRWPHRIRHRVGSFLRTTATLDRLPSANSVSGRERYFAGSGALFHEPDCLERVWQDRFLLGWHGLDRLHLGLLPPA